MERKLQICVVDVEAFLNNEDCDFVFYDFVNFNKTDAEFSFDQVESWSNPDFYPFVQHPLNDNSASISECRVENTATYYFETSRYAYVFVYSDDEHSDEYISRKFMEVLPH